jgi:hypothetical protein
VNRIVLSQPSGPSCVDTDDESVFYQHFVKTLKRAMELKGTMLVAEENSRQADVIKKAKSMLGKGIIYKLGAGGRNPNNRTPETIRDGILGCDCAGYVAWAWGFDRFQDYSLWLKNKPGQFSPNSLTGGEIKGPSSDYNMFDYYGGWINTDSMMEDSLDNNNDWFINLDSPVPGCIVSYGSTGKGSSRRIGHEGLVIAAPALFDRENPEHWRRLEVIDCRSAKPAILVRDGMTWFGKDRKGRPKQSQFCWPNFVSRYEE